MTTGRAMRSAMLASPEPSTSAALGARPAARARIVAAASCGVGGLIAATAAGRSPEQSTTVRDAGALRSPRQLLRAEGQRQQLAERERALEPIGPTQIHRGVQPGKLAQTLPAAAAGPGQDRPVMNDEDLRDRLLARRDHDADGGRLRALPLRI